MDMGLDSLAAVEFRNRMQSAFGGLRLSPTLMFDYPTVADLSDYVLRWQCSWLLSWLHS